MPTNISWQDTNYQLQEMIAWWEIYSVSYDFEKL